MPWWRRWTSRRVIVRERSMAPVLWPGDRLLIDRFAYRCAEPREGEIVLLRDPESPGRWLLKRIGARIETPEGARYSVLGDDAAVSRDSRSFGPVGRGAIAGRAWFRYAPADRRGPL